MTNIEMFEFLQARRAEKRERIERDGCCGDVGALFSDGVCFGFGPCPRLVQTDQCVRFATDVVTWANQVNEESALAAVAARLGDVPVYEGIER